MYKNVHVAIWHTYHFLLHPDSYINHYGYYTTHFLTLVPVSTIEDSYKRMLGLMSVLVASLSPLSLPTTPIVCSLDLSPSFVSTLRLEVS